MPLFKNNISLCILFKITIFSQTPNAFLFSLPVFGSFEQSDVGLTLLFAKHTGKWYFPWYYNLVHIDSERLGIHFFFIVNVFKYHDVH